MRPLQNRQDVGEGLHHLSPQIAVVHLGRRPLISCGSPANPATPAPIRSRRQGIELGHIAHTPADLGRHPTHVCVVSGDEKNEVLGCFFSVLTSDSDESERVERVGASLGGA